MFELRVKREFHASHAITIGGDREEAHSHTWKVTVVVGGNDLDEDGLLYDFHVIERYLDEVIQSFNNADLNSTPPFDSINPTAENVVKYVAEELATRLPQHVKLIRASITEAPGCIATFIM